MPSRIAPADALQTYVHKIQENLASGISSEDTHRSALEHLLESIDPAVRAFNDPKHISVGAPDFTVPTQRRCYGFSNRLSCAARRTARLLFRVNKIVFAVATFSVKERWPASIEGFQLVDERMVRTAY
jgi:hypothetical protein